MSLEISLQKLLSRLEGVYQAVDIRAAFVKEQDAWKRALVVPRFSYKSVDDINKELYELVNRWGIVETQNFKIEFIFADFEDGWRFLCDVDKSLPSLALHEAYILRKRSEWKLFEGSSGEHSRLLDEVELEREVRAKYPFGVYDAINELLEINFSAHISLDLAVGVPFYARIENLDFGGQRCKISVKFHRKISDLVVDVAVRERERYQGALKESHRVKIDINQSRSLNDYLCLWEKEIELRRASHEDYIIANLRHIEPDALDIDESGGQIGWLLKAKKPGGNLLWDAFCRFSDKETFETYLTSPHEYKDAQDRFERAVSWLLGICGFQTIWLGRTELEQIRAKTTKVERGASTDILACHEKDENLLFLIECTINPPKDEDINKLTNLRRILLDEVFKGTQVQISPFIFSGAAELGVKEKGGVKVLDANDIRDLLNLATQRRMNMALFKYFGIKS